MDENVSKVVLALVNEVIRLATDSTDELYSKEKRREVLLTLLKCYDIEEEDLMELNLL